MSKSPVITRIELTSFTIQLPNIGTDAAGAGVNFRPGDGQ